MDNGISLFVKFLCTVKKKFERFHSTIVCYIVCSLQYQKVKICDSHFIVQGG